MAQAQPDSNRVDKHNPGVPQDGLDYLQIVEPPLWQLSRSPRCWRLINLSKSRQNASLASSGKSLSAAIIWITQSIEGTFEPLFGMAKAALSNQSQWRTNESLGPPALQKRKVENCELRLADETRAFRPENGN
jgi:hypothetical protein